MRASCNGGEQSEWRIADGKSERGLAGLAGLARAPGAVGGCLKLGQSSHATVQDVIGEVSSREARRSGMRIFYRKPGDPVKKKTPDPFSWASPTPFLVPLRHLSC